MIKSAQMPSRGFVLLPVMLAIAVVAAVAFLINRESAIQLNMAAGEAEVTEAQYVAEAGLRHALWAADNSACTGYALASTGFGEHSYSASFTPTSGSPINITATGNHASGITRTLSKTSQKIYETPVTLVLQPDASDGKDGMPDSFYNNRNYGGADYFQVNSDPGWFQRPMLQFDLSSIAPGAKIISALLEMNQESINTAGEISAHAVTRTWTEGTKSGTGQPDGASWETWDGTGAWTQVGGDYDSSAYGTTPISSATNGQWFAMDIGELAQEWVSGKLSNHGLMLIGNDVVRQAKFTSSDHTNPLLFPKLTITYACECGVLCSAGITLGNLLMVVNDPASLTTLEADKKALIESWGYTITLIDDHDSQANFDAAVADNDVAYIPQGVNTSALDTKLVDATTGVIIEDRNFADEFGIVSNNGQFDVTVMSITDNSHYITQPFSIGALTVFTSAQQSVYKMGGQAAPGMQALGAIGSDESLITVDKNGTIIGGGTAAGRRVLMPWGGSNGFDVNLLTDDGKTLFQRALEWTATTAPDPNAPWAHWKLDDGTGLTAIDSVGGHDGTLTTGGPAWTMGQLDGALDFDGVDDYVDLTADAELTDVFDGGATAMAWIYPRTWGESVNGRILDKSSQVSGDRDGWMIAVKGDSPSFQFAQGFTGTRGYWRSQTGSVKLNEWVHVAVVYDASSVANDAEIYLNGVKQTSLVEITPTGAIATDAGIALRMGNYAQDTSRTFDGKIDDARIYDRMLSDTEIADIVAAGGGSGGIVYEEFTEAKRTSNGRNLSISKPAGTATGDLLIAAVVTDGKQETGISAPAGWELIKFGIQSEQVSMGVWWKLATDSESSSYSFTWSEDEEAYGWIMRFSGHDPDQPINDIQDTGDRSSTPESKKVRTDAPYELVLRIGGFDDDDIVVDEPGLPGHTVITMDKSSSGSGTVSGGAGYLLQAATGDSGSSNFSLKRSEEFRTVTISIVPK